MLRILIVDDEPLARKALERAVSRRSDVLECDCATDAIQALEMISLRNYDVLLVDIAMPELSGMELVDRLRKREQAMPAVVFVTAHSSHAVHAFQARAVDYVLKPFSPDRIQDAIDHAKQRSSAQRLSALVDALPTIREKAQRPKMAIKSKGRILLIDPGEVIAIKAEGNYALLERSTGSDILRESISTLAEKLKTFGFVRIHRSVLVNTSHIEELSPLFSGDYLVKMKGGKEFTISRNYKRNLAEFIDLWIGTEGLSRH